MADLADAPTISIDSAVHDFAACGEVLPREAMQWALDHWDEAGPRFVELIEQFASGEDTSVETREALFFVIHLLGEKAEKKAYAPLCRLILDDEVSEQVLGDAVTENLIKILISICDGDPVPLTTLIETGAANEFARSSAFRTLAYLAATNRLSGFDMRDYLSRFPTDLQPEEGNYVWVGWLDAIAYMGYDELTPLVEEAFSRELIDEMAMDLADYRRILGLTLADPRRMAACEHDGLGPFGSAIENLSRWYWFSEERRQAKERAAAEVEEPNDWADGWTSLVPAVNPVRDVGRNDPCPCGSGKKFKKCCL